uniref:Uncharacterized protein n=1 Tax=Panagrellus redivivus TaxID=6233 RepID=A0A7E4VVK2_PANRE
MSIRNISEEIPVSESSGIRTPTRSTVERCSSRTYKNYENGDQVVQCRHFAMVALARALFLLFGGYNGGRGYGQTRSLGILEMTTDKHIFVDLYKSE